MSNYHNQYRPTELDMVLGQEHVISALQEYKRKNNWPHAFLFTGSAGTGKTTLSRIIGKELGADKTGIIEVDAAVFNGVETMRSLIGDLQYTNLGESDIKFIILDECFAKDTLVNTPNGEIPIQLIKPGDTVYNMTGSAKVKHTFANQIPLDRVVKVHLDSGKAMICSCDHLFFTDQGWIKAKNLNNQMIVFNFALSHTSFPNHSGTVQNDSKMLSLWNYVSEQANGQFFKESLFSVLRHSITTQISYCSELVLLSLSSLSKNFYTPQTDSYSINLLTEMWQYSSWNQTYGQTFRGTKISCSKRYSNIQTPKQRIMAASFRKSIKIDDSTQSILPTNQFGQSQKNQIGTWQSSSLVRNKRWKWDTDRTTNYTRNSFRMGSSKTERSWLSSVVRQLASRVFNKNGSFIIGWNWLSTILQSRYWMHFLKNLSRGRWDWAPVENKYKQRYKERAKTTGIRVDHVEVYQRGNNDESFKSVIEDSERNQGFVTLYDLEIDGHPSYYAESCLVHNCHMLSKSSWNSLLKVVEEPPAHVYFAFCTTESDKVPNTIQSRCTQFNLKPVSHSDLCSLLEAIVSLENLPIPPQGIDLIARNAFGSPRNALTALNLCGHCANLDEVRIALEEAEGDADSIELCRLLTGNTALTWKKAVTLLKRMDNKAPESIRLLVVNYVAKALVSTTSESIAVKYLAILDAFSKPCNPSEKMAPILLAIGTLLLSNPE